MAESTQITAKLLCWAWPRSWHTMVLSFQCPTSMSLTCPCTLEQICSISPISKCSIATQRWLVSHCNSLTHGIWHRKATNSREVGAVQPEGKYLEIPSWDLTTTVRFTIHSTPVSPPFLLFCHLLAILIDHTASYLFPDNSCLVSPLRHHSPCSGWCTPARNARGPFLLFCWLPPCLPPPHRPCFLPFAPGLAALFKERALTTLLQEPTCSSWTGAGASVQPAKGLFSLLAATQAISLLCPDHHNSFWAVARGIQHHITPSWEVLLPAVAWGCCPSPSHHNQTVSSPQDRLHCLTCHQTGLPWCDSSARLRLAVSFAPNSAGNRFRPLFLMRVSSVTLWTWYYSHTTVKYHIPMQWTPRRSDSTS